MTSLIDAKLVAWMKLARFFFALPSVLLFSGCAMAGSEPASSEVAHEPLPVFVRSSIRSNLELEALAKGRLEIDKNGCLRIGGANGPFVIWHHDSRIERTGDGRIRITDGYSGNTAYVGDEIAMGGGVGNRVPPASGPRLEVPTNTTVPIPAACAAGEIWIAGRLMTEAERQRLPKL